MGIGLNSKGLPCIGAAPFPLPNPAEMCYTGSAALLQSGNRKEVLGLEYFANFLVAVGASVVAYYIRKWLDGHGKGK